MKAMAALAVVGLALLAGCSTLGVGKDNEPAMITDANVNRIQNREWALKSLQLDGRQIVMDLEANMTLKFGADGKATGFGSVNQFSGGYSFSPNAQLAWTRPGFVTTRRAGPPELMEKERLYLEALTKTSRAIVKGHALQLQSEDGSTALPFIEAGY
jgi:heat shock protein HslJ